jgi:hypothetical protein
MDLRLTQQEAEQVLDGRSLLPPSKPHHGKPDVMGRLYVKPPAAPEPDWHEEPAIAMREESVARNRRDSGTNFTPEAVKIAKSEANRATARGKPQGLTRDDLLEEAYRVVEKETSKNVSFASPAFDFKRNGPALRLRIRDRLRDLITQRKAEHERSVEINHDTLGIEWSPIAASKKVPKSPDLIR